MAESGAAFAGTSSGAADRAAPLERAATYRMAAELFAREPDAELLALASTVPALASHATPGAAARYTHVFVLNAYPFASVYLDADGGIDGDHAGFTRGVLEALGLRVTAGDAADHIAVQLDAVAALLEREGADDDPAGRDAARARHAQRVLLGEHLLPWAPLFLDAVERVDDGLYRAAARWTRDALVDHASALLDADPWRPEARPAVEDAPDPGGTPAPLSAVERLSVPARGGLLLCRADLARIGGALGVPLRFGGRRFMLEGLAQAALQQGASEALTAALVAVVRERRRHLDAWALDLPQLGVLWEPWRVRLDGTLAALEAPSEADAARAARPVGAG